LGVVVGQFANAANAAEDDAWMNEFTKIVRTKIKFKD
jgi:hypothetical protein